MVCCYLFLLVVLFVALLLNITLAIINQHMLIEATNDVDTTWYMLQTLGYMYIYIYLYTFGIYLSIYVWIWDNPSCFSWHFTENRGNKATFFFFFKMKLHCKFRDLQRNDIGSFKLDTIWQSIRPEEIPVVDWTIIYILCFFFCTDRFLFTV